MQHLPSNLIMNTIFADNPLALWQQYVHLTGRAGHSNRRIGPTLGLFDLPRSANEAH